MPDANPAALDLLARRRSVKATELRSPGPDAAELRTLLEIAMRVPDHGKLGPWRFIVLQGDSRAQMGRVLADRWRALHPDEPAECAELEGARLLRAPVVVAVISCPNRRAVKIPLWEQQLSSGAACQNLLNAALFAGLGAQWITEWYAYDEVVDAALGLSGDERVAGYVYIGSVEEAPSERKRPGYESRVSEWSPR